MNTEEPTKAPQVGQSALTDVLGARCPECGSSNTEWQCSQYTDSDIQDGRLRMHEIKTRFFLGCNCCSETISVISGDKLARLMTESANATARRPPETD